MIKVGNVSDINGSYKEWFLGKFVKEPEFNTANSKNLEVKWSIKEKGFSFPIKEQVVNDHTCKSMVILTRGKFKYSFLLEQGIFEDYLLNKEGDYIYWTPDINHKTEALDDSVLLTIRWFSQK